MFLGRVSILILPSYSIWVHDDPILIRLVIDEEVIWTTPEHPFYLGNGQWISAGDLQDGDLIRNANWQLGIVQDVTTIYQTQTMYNLSVDTAHTYFVGEQQWLVHNDCSWKINAGDLGIVGELDQFDVTFTLRDDSYSSMYFDIVEGNIMNQAEVFGNILAYAREHGAHTLWLEGAFANPRLRRVLEQRYDLEFLTIDGQEIVEIALD